MLLKSPGKAVFSYTQLLLDSVLRRTEMMGEQKRSTTDDAVVQVNWSPAYISEGMTRLVLGFFYCPILRTSTDGNFSFYAQQNVLCIEITIESGIL